MVITLFGTAHSVGGLDYVTGTGPGDGINKYDAAVLGDPFSMTIQTGIAGGHQATWDATVVAAIPLPAAGFLLLGALGGLGALRRRRKTA